jgi:hypothetical protein
MINASPRIVVMVLASVGSVGSHSSARAADELPERARLACQYIEPKAAAILAFAYPSGSGAELSKPTVRFDGHRKLEDGFELTYTFLWDAPSGTRKESYVTLAFLFDADGQVDGILVKEADVRRGEAKDPLRARYVVMGYVKPFFNDVSDVDDLESLRHKLRSHPKIKDNRKHLRTVETASAREMCELWLRLEQPRK